MVLKHIKYSLPANLNQHQYAYRAHRSTKDAITTALHIALTRLDQQGMYVRVLFIDYSSAFSTSVPSRLVTKLFGLGLNSPLCMWMKDFLSNRQSTWHTYLPESDSQHWSATGLCSESNALFTIYYI